MPTRVLRRTPASEKAAIYGYKDLLKDSISHLREKAGANVERMISGGMGDEEVLEAGLAPVGGMLKIRGLAKMLPKVVMAQKGFQVEDPLKKQFVSNFQKSAQQNTLKAYKELLKVPEKEYRRIKDIRWGSGGNSPLATAGEFDPATNIISYSPQFVTKDTIWHEFVHGRQFNPEKGKLMPSGELSEFESTRGLIRLWNNLIRAAVGKGVMSTSDFYQTVSPIERHARAAAGILKSTIGRKVPLGAKLKSYDNIFQRTLDEELRIGEQSLEALVGREAVRKSWEEALFRSVRELD